MLAPSSNNCKIEESLNYLYSIYGGRTNKKTDLIIAINISNLLCHLGKEDMALNMLLSYNAEALLKRKNEVVLKCLYYNTLCICYIRRNNKEQALECLNRVRVILNSPYLNPKAKAIYEENYKINLLICRGDENDVTELLSLLEQALSKQDTLLRKVNLRFSIVRLLKEHNRMNEAEEHIEFIKENGGDTVYAQCARQNDFSNEILNQINNEPWAPTPIKFKDSKPAVFSVIISVVLVTLVVLFGFATAKTIYQTEYNSQGIYSIYTFNSKGDILTLEWKCHGDYPTKDSADYQYEYLQQYMYYNNFKGCEATLTQLGKRIDFDLTFNFSKTGEKFADFVTTEQDYVKNSSNGGEKISRYKSFLYVTWFDGVL